MTPAYASTDQTQPVFAGADTAFEEVKAWLSSSTVRVQTHASVERELRVKGAELLRRMMEAHIGLRGMAEPTETVVGADGQERPHRRGETLRRLETIFGTVEVSRPGFSGKGLSALHPTDASLNLPCERYSHEVRRQVAWVSAQNSFDASLETLERLTAAHVPKRQAEGLVLKAAQDFELFYEQTQVEGEAQGEFLILSFDGKGVVMRPEGLREGTRKRAKGKKSKLKSRGSRGEPRGRKRMALVATVYGIGAHERTAEQVIHGLCGVTEVERPKQRPPRPEQKRVWASLVDTPEEIIEAAFREAHARDPNHEKRWLVLVDGERRLEDQVRKVAREQGAEVELVLDFIHALEYLWKAGLALHKEGTPELESWVLDRLKRLLEGKVSQVVAGMRRSATRRKLSKKKRAPIDRAATYLLKRKSMVRYDELLQAGAPIATGVIEGTCRHLINDRLDITGARWGLAGAEAILKLRSLIASGDFDDYWAFHEEAEYTRNHRRRYAGGRPPEVEIQRKARHLRVVK